jgi:hypothetical protein
MEGHYTQIPGRGMMSVMAILRHSTHPKCKPRLENGGLITIRNAILATVSRIGLSRRPCRFRCCCPTSTKKSRGAIPAFSGRLVQPREVSQATKATSLVGMASLFDLDGLVGEHRVHASESPVQHRPSAYGILSVIAIYRQLRTISGMAGHSQHIFASPTDVTFNVARLFVSKRLHGIDPSRMAGGKVACEKRNRDEDE